MWIYFYKVLDNQCFARTYFCNSDQTLHNLQKLIHAKVCPNKVIKFLLTTCKWQHIIYYFVFYQCILWEQSLTSILRKLYLIQNLEIYLLRYSFFTYGEPHKKLHSRIWITQHITVQTIAFGLNSCQWPVPSCSLDIITNQYNLQYFYYLCFCDSLLRFQVHRKFR